MADSFEDKIAQCSEHRIGEPSAKPEDAFKALQAEVGKIEEALALVDRGEHDRATRLLAGVFNYATEQRVHLIVDSTRPLPDPREVVMALARRKREKAREAEPPRYAGPNWRSVMERFDISDTRQALGEADERFGEHLRGSYFGWPQLTLDQLVEDGKLTTTPTKQFYRLAQP